MADKSICIPRCGGDDPPLIVHRCWSDDAELMAIEIDGTVIAMDVIEMRALRAAITQTLKSKALAKGGRDG